MSIDYYVYPNTQILKNKFDIRNETVLNETEAEYTSLRLKQIMQNNKDINGNYDFKHLCSMHYYIFQDIYEWAGIPRTINIEKSELALGGLSVEYSNVENMEDDINHVLNKIRIIHWDKISLEEKALAFSENLAELWKVHCFREGNTRTTITFLCKLMESKGISINYSLFEKNSVYVRTALVAANANFKDLGNLSKPEYLHRIIKDSLQNIEKSSQKSLKEKKAVIESKRKEEIQKQYKNIKNSKDKDDLRH